MSVKLPLSITAIITLTSLITTPPTALATSCPDHRSSHGACMYDVSGSMENPDDAGSIPPNADHLNHQKYGVIGSKAGLGAWIIRYDNSMFRGGSIKDSSGIDSLRELGIETVITASATDEERAMIQAAGISMIEFPLEKDTCDDETIEKYTKLLDFIDKPVYVHGGFSKHRAGILALLYRLHHGWNPKDALLEFAFLGGSLADNYPMIESILEAHKDEKIGHRQ